MAEIVNLKQQRMKRGPRPTRPRERGEPVEIIIAPGAMKTPAPTTTLTRRHEAAQRRRTKAEAKARQDNLDQIYTIKMIIHLLGADQRPPLTPEEARALVATEHVSMPDVENIDRALRWLKHFRDLCAAS